MCVCVGGGGGKQLVTLNDIVLIALLILTLSVCYVMIGKKLGNLLQESPLMIEYIHTQIK